MPMNSGPAPTVVNRNQDYLTDLRHDLQDDEYAFLYLSACAVEGGDTLRLGLRDVKEAWLASHPLQDKPPADHFDADGKCTMCGWLSPKGTIIAMGEEDKPPDALEESK